MRIMIALPSLRAPAFWFGYPHRSIWLSAQLLMAVLRRFAPCFCLALRFASFCLLLLLLFTKRWRGFQVPKTGYPHNLARLVMSFWKELASGKDVILFLFGDLMSINMRINSILAITCYRFIDRLWIDIGILKHVVVLRISCGYKSYIRQIEYQQYQVRRRTEFEKGSWAQQFC